jgi:hypothetical protein
LVKVSNFKSQSPKLWFFYKLKGGEMGREELGPLDKYGAYICFQPGIGPSKKTRFQKLTQPITNVVDKLRGIELVEGASGDIYKTKRTKDSNGLNEGNTSRLIGGID